jgi:hypothetical protein
MDRYTAGISACYSTSAVSVSTGNPSGGISGQHNYIAGVLAPHREDGRFQASVIEPFDNFKPGFSLTPTPPEQFAGYSPPKYYEGEAKDCYWSGTGPSAGIGKVEGASPVDNQNTGCTQFSGAAPSAPSGPNWGVGSNPTAGQYWTSSYKLYWE